MTYQEIWEQGEQGKIDIFEAHKLLEERLEETVAKSLNSLKNWNAKEKGAFRDSAEYKEIDKEQANITQLRDYLEKSVFNNVAEKLLNVHYAESAFQQLMRNIFFLEKSKNTDDFETQKEITQKSIKSFVDFLETLNCKL